MYIAGRSRTASKPSRTLILLESYTSTGVTSLVAMLCCSVLLFPAACSLPAAACSSDPHRHHHIPILVIRGAVAGWAQLAGAMRILEMKRYLRLRGGSQKIQHVACIETNLYGTSVVLHRKALLALAGLGKRR